ncbi:hypothetical protein [Aeromonas salmonicida]
MNVNLIKKSSFAVILLSASFGAMAAPTVNQTKNFTGEVTVGASSFLNVAFTPKSGLTVDNFELGKSGNVDVLSFVPTVNSGALVASRFLNPSNINTTCTNATGVLDVNNMLTVCVDAAFAANNSIILGSENYVSGVSGQTYTLLSPISQTVKADTYQVKMVFVNYTN